MVDLDRAARPSARWLKVVLRCEEQGAPVVTAFLRRAMPSP